MKIIIFTGDSKETTVNHVVHKAEETTGYLGFPETHKHPREFKKDIYEALEDVKSDESICIVTLNKMVINIVADYMEERKIASDQFTLTHVTSESERIMHLDDEYCLTNCLIGFMDYY
jgi:hypothetical protein